jgi:hypothetical protein
MSKARTRLVNFRVTDEEFARLKSTSDQQGARCLSDFARAVIFGHPEIHAPAGWYDERLVSFDRRLTALERSMSRLTDALANSQGEGAGSHR